MLHGQAPGFNVQVASSLALQFAGVVGLLARRNAGEVWFGLLVGGLKRKQSSVWAGGRRKDGYPECVTLQSGVQVVVLRSAVIDAEAGTDHGFSIEPARRPSQ